MNVSGKKTYEDRLADIREEAARWAEREACGPLDDDERARLNRWIADSPANALELDLARSLRDSSELEIALSIVDSELRQARRRPRFSWFTPPPAFIGAAAAALALLVMAPLLGVHFPWMGERAPSTITFTTLNGQPRIERLADGSVLELNGGTQVAVNLKRNVREIEVIAGDAVFSVAKDPDRPFVVEAGRTRVTALGTVFSVNRFDASTVVYVIESRVRVDSLQVSGRSVTAAAGTRIEADDSQTLQVTNFEPDSSFDWREGWIDTPSITLVDLAQLIERRTGERIVLADAVRTRTVSGRFRIDDPATTLQRIALVLGLEIQATRSGVIISPAVVGSPS
ncbi:MAG: FecR domain-containing protein [Hyphomonadaceae bacterium]